MIADPRKNPADTITAWAYGDPITTGNGKLGAGPRFHASVRKQAISLCVTGDEVCNAPRSGASRAVSNTHKHYYEKLPHAASTGKQLYDVLRRNGAS